MGAVFALRNMAPGPGRADPTPEQGNFEMTTSNQSAPRAQRRRRLFMHYVRGSLIMVCSFAGLAIALALMT